MPHSPRWHDGRLWLLNSGEGELVVVDLDGRRETVCRLPGYLRGLGFAGNIALVGMSKIRERHIFGDLPIQSRLRLSNEELVCGIALVDTSSGQCIGMLKFTQGCEELFAIEYLAGFRRPMILNLERPEARQAIAGSEWSFWMRPENEIKGDINGHEIRAELAGMGGVR
jgi:uncharacterized protein (TIGR03032 family)